MRLPLYQHPLGLRSKGKMCLSSNMTCKRFSLKILNCLVNLCLISAITERGSGFEISVAVK